MDTIPVTAEPEPGDQAVLEAVEAALNRAQLRGHIYLPRTGPVVFATRRQRSVRPLHRNLGPRPVRAALADAVGETKQAQRWLQELHARYTRNDATPAPVLWNTPHLVVTGCMASRALCAVLEHPNEYEPAVRQKLMDEAAIRTEAEAAAIFTELMQREPGQNPADTHQRNAGRPARP